jgi:hypothetical protein
MLPHFRLLRNVNDKVLILKSNNSGNIMQGEISAALKYEKII